MTDRSETVTPLTFSDEARTQMRNSARKHYFTDVDYHVITLLLPTGEYGAYRTVEDEGRIRGFGHTRLAAIADLKEWLEDQADDGE